MTLTQGLMFFVATAAIQILMGALVLVAIGELSEKMDKLQEKEPKP